MHGVVCLHRRHVKSPSNRSHGDGPPSYADFAKSPLRPSLSTAPPGHAPSSALPCGSLLTKPAALSQLALCVSLSLLGRPAHLGRPRAGPYGAASQLERLAGHVASLDAADSLQTLLAVLCDALAATAAQHALLLPSVVPALVPGSLPAARSALLLTLDAGAGGGLADAYSGLPMSRLASSELRSAPRRPGRSRPATYSHQPSGEQGRTTPRTACLLSSGDGLSAAVALPAEAVPVLVRANATGGGLTCGGGSQPLQHPLLAAGGRSSSLRVLPLSPCTLLGGAASADARDAADAAAVAAAFEELRRVAPTLRARPFALGHTLLRSTLGEAVRRLAPQLESAGGMPAGGASAAEALRDAAGLAAVAVAEVADCAAHVQASRVSWAVGACARRRPVCFPAGPGSERRRFSLSVSSHPKPLSP